MCLISTERAGVLITYSSLFQIKCSGGKKSHEFWWSASGSEMNCAWDCECVSCWFTRTSLRLALAVPCLALICCVSAPVPPSLSLMSVWLTAAVSELSGAPPLTTFCWRLDFFSPIHLPPLRSLLTDQPKPRIKQELRFWLVSVAPPCQCGE